ncbi:MAG: patatin-like phospholipase family protein [Halothiobacillaceae bacterium]|nr:patatin-like phospholipase family protein [Halothiobacillaceae bacterium]
MHHPLISSLIIASLIAALSGCSTLPRSSAVPPEQVESAIIPGMVGIRYVEGNPKDMARMREDTIALWPKELAWQVAQGKSGEQLQPSYMLALSGGGDKGAYGAGFLNGWTQSGTRPEFSLVTGVSTGALIAPFAFLGADYDDALKAFYTNTSREDLVELRNVLAAISGDSLIDTTPLLNLIRREITQEVLDKIAVEERKGRLLLISTTNIDTGQRVIWNMTKLATSQDPRTLDMFHKVMLASAAIPAAFPPVIFDVEVNGKRYSEMHVDGGTTSQVFIYPPNIKLGKLSHQHGGERRRELFVIMNDLIHPDREQTERSVFHIAGRAIGTLIHSQGVGDLYRLYTTTQRDGVKFNYTYIPADFKHPNANVFNTDYMRALYARGFQEATSVTPWQHIPGER